jgi:hypothetical protein
MPVLWDECRRFSLAHEIIRPLLPGVLPGVLGAQDSVRDCAPFRASANAIIHSKEQNAARSPPWENRSGRLVMDSAQMVQVSGLISTRQNG